MYKYDYICSLVINTKNKMKKSTLLFLLIATFIFSFKNRELNSNVIFSGKIENPNSDTLNILDINYNIIKTIVLDKDNTFRDTLNITEGYYRLGDGTEGTQMYLKPNFNLILTLNTNEFDESILYKGNGAKENNYLAKKTLLNESFGILNYYGYYGKLSEKDFLKLTDSLYDIQKSLLKSNKGLDKNFFYVESKSLEFEKLNKYANFEGMNRFITGNGDFKVSKNYPNAFANVNLLDEKLLISPNYLNYIQSYLRKKSDNKIKSENANVDNILAYVKTIKTEVKNSLIKEELIYNVGKQDLNYTSKLDSVYYELMLILTNEKYISEVTEKYTTLKKVENGAVSPTFTLNDINGKTISLNDLKGKLVYIDIWATWCLPCTKEIPNLAKMEEHFKGKDIYFVSICQNDTKERWEQMVEDKKLGGIQLFAPNEDIAFFKDYSVNGIPRFILIDRNGKIIDANAKRPSDPGLQEEIEKYL